ncbi:MAG: NAD(P)/FAD-dependent oxidoreductase [Actinomycetota bacterium]|nr:NAD(P)/FAD-dependent oxidoreductase [Actinomycetota bacterium]
MQPQNRVRIVIIGTGFSGLGVAIGLKRARIDDFVIFERADAVGGTWRDNTYPGCQCDVPSHLYSFSFRPNPEWSRTYSTQPEIFAYLDECAREAGVMPHVRFGHEVTSARWDEDAGVWAVETSRGTWTAEVLISANGALAEPAIPDIPGFDDFAGPVVHSAAWDHEVSFQGKRVAVLGTGASAIQIIPHLQREAKRLTVFQRTPAWVMPHTDRPISERERKLYRRFPVMQKAVRKAIYGARELLVLGMVKNRRFLRPLEKMARAHIRSKVRDPELRRKLRPSYSLGCKRILLSDHYYPALDADNCELVTERIVAFNESGVLTTDETQHEVDAIVLATGFRVTDNPVMEGLVGRGGVSLADAWRRDGMRAYNGTTVPGFPNMFMMTGPNTGIGHTSLLVMIEAQINYVVRALRYMSKVGAATIEVRPESTEAFNNDLQKKMKNTVWTMGGCASWYLDDKGNNTTLWPDFTWKFRRATRTFDPAAYMVTHRRAGADLGDAEQVPA